LGFEPGPEDSYGSVEVKRSGRLFQTRAAATGKAGSRVRLTISDEDELERSRWRECKTWAYYNSNSYNKFRSKPTYMTYMTTIP